MPRYGWDIANDLVKGVAEEVTFNDDSSDAAGRLVLKLAVHNKAVVVERVFIFLPSPRSRLPSHPTADALIINLIDPFPFGLRTSRALGVGLFVLHPLDTGQATTCGSSSRLLCTGHRTEDTKDCEEVVGDKLLPVLGAESGSLK